MSGGNITFDVTLGSVGGKIADDATKVGVLLLKVVEADSTLRTRATVAAILAASNTEADFSGYARKTSITATRTVDTGAHTVSLDIPDQTWTAAATGNNLVKLIVFYEEAAADSTRIPLTAHTITVTTDGSDIVAQIANFDVCS